MFRDIHTHILPSVDDGSPDMDTSMRMVEAAQRAGVTELVCTPHCRNPYFDYDRMTRAFKEFSQASRIPAIMGFEVAHSKLLKLGIDEWGPRLGTRETGRFLLELDFGCTASDFPMYEETIYRLQGQGWRVVIAHPERYDAIRKDATLAKRLVDDDCELQASANFTQRNSHGSSKRTAVRLLKQGLYSYIASDAHAPNGYDTLAKTMARYGKYLR